MSERQVTIGSKVGLHARPASLFAKAVKNAGVPVQIAKDGQPPVNAASLLSLLTLGAEFGENVTLYAEGEGAKAALDELAAMLGRDLDED
jgi:phosphocarrier protein HPr